MTNEEQIRDLLDARTRLYERQQQCLEALYKTERALETALAELARARATMADQCAEIARLREALDRALTGGNSIASALINADIMPQDVRDPQALLELGVEWYMMWQCWRCMMDARDIARPANAAD